MWKILAYSLSSDEPNLCRFKCELLEYFKQALKNTYDTDDSRTWKFLFLCCNTCRTLSSAKKSRC